ncbi:200 kDa antigen p200, putative [Cronobacter muytjensii 530]
MRETPDNRREDNRNDPDRRRGKPRPGGGIAVYLLQQLRQQHNRAEVEHIGKTDAQTANGEVARLKQREVDNRVLVGQLPDNQEAERDHGHDRQHHDFSGVKPVELFALVEHHLETADADDQQRQPHSVNAPLFGAGFAATQRLQRHQHHSDADRHVDKEDPAPVVVIADPAAEDRAADGGDDHRHRPQRQRDGALGRRVVAQQQTLGKRDQRPGHNPLNHAEENQHVQAVGDTACPGGDGESDGGPDEQTHLADASSEPAGNRDRDGVRHPERGDNPGALTQRGAQVTGNRRDSHVGDGGVQHLHERGKRQGDGHNDQLRPFQRFTLLLHTTSAG